MNLSCLPYFLALWFLQVPAFAQIDSHSVSDSLLKDAMELYALEVASWYSASIITERLSTEDVSKFLSYKEKDKIKTVYWSAENPGRIKYTLSYDLPLDPEYAKIDGELRKPTRREKRLKRIRKKSKEMIRTDTAFFKIYERIPLNIMMLQRGRKVLVYVIPETREFNEILFGNDYLLTFKRRGKLKSREKLHQNLITVEARPERGGEDVVLTSVHIHSKKSSPYITATDLYILFLYKDILNWDNHIVFSEKYVSFFSFKEHGLLIMDRKEFEEMNGE